MRLINTKQEEIQEKHGVYKITNILNNKIYIGSAKNLFRRNYEHTILLESNRHFNTYLQNSWNKYGENSFTFEIVEFVDNLNELIKREQFWIDKLNVIDKKVGYNINPKAGSRLGAKLTPEQLKAQSERMKKYCANLTPEEKAKKYNKEFGMKISKTKLAKKHRMTEESRKKMSIAKTGMNTGKRPKEVGEKISQSKMGHKFTPLGSDHGKAVYNEELVTNIKLMLHEGYSIYEVADKYNVKRSAVYDIKDGRSWSHVLPDLDLSTYNRTGKLNTKKVKGIKLLLLKGVTPKEIASIFNVSATTIRDIKKGKTWKNVIVEEAI